MVMFDSLNRRMLPPYGCDWVQAPNFQRLAERSVVFDRAFIGSMPCMPARRDLHTGRYNFLHRSWGPLEPFDDSMPDILKRNSVHTHLCSDHGHYWEDGGCTYHPRYSSWEIARGQEGDPWKGDVREQSIPDHLGMLWPQDWINRQHLGTPDMQPQTVTFANGLEFIETNHDQENWYLQIETFDPHEPFFSHEEFKRLYPHNWDGPQFDWPPYDRVSESPDAVAHVRYEYAALLSMCDRSLGRVLDMMDRHRMWDDTMLIVNTDHGYLLGEHDWWAKCIQPFYNEVAHIPLFIWDPRSRKRGVRNDSLVQTIDLPATLLEYFGVPLPEDMHGVPLRETLETGASVRDYCLFGVHGSHVNCTDGRFVYMRAPTSEENGPLYEYTVMPTHMRSMFSVQELQHAELAQPFSFTKGVPLLRIPAAKSPWSSANRYGTLLFDNEADPLQQAPLHDNAIENRLTEAMVDLMRANDAPAEQYARLGLV